MNDIRRTEDGLHKPTVSVKPSRRVSFIQCCFHLYLSAPLPFFRPFDALYAKTSEAIQLLYVRKKCQYSLDILTCEFVSEDIFSEWVYPIRKTSLNDSLTNQTDPRLNSS